MSFHWNLSSDEEDETEEWKSKLIVADKSGAARAPNPTLATPTLRQEAAKNDSSVARMPTNNQNVQGFDFSEDDDEEEVDWEDADDNDDAEVEEEDSKMPAKETPTFRPVTIDMNQKTAATSPSKTKKKKRGRRSYRFHSLPPHLQSLLIHIQQSHLLALASRAMQISRCCSDVELLHVVHSLVPVVEANSIVPTEAEVRGFVSWYTYFVNHVEQRRRNIRAANEAAGAPAVRRSKKRKAPPLDVDRLGSVQPDRLLQISSYLSPANDDHPPPDGDDFMELSNQDKVQLLVAMVR